jgi:predicted transposase YdaD
LQINLKLRHNKTKDIEEVIMNLSPAYEKWYEETLAIGEARGEARGRNLERLAIAQTMLQEGAAIALITKVTGFSTTEIEQLNLES